MRICIELMAQMLTIKSSNEYLKNRITISKTLQIKDVQITNVQIFRARNSYSNAVQLSSAANVFIQAHTDQEKKK